MNARERIEQVPLLRVLVQRGNLGSNLAREVNRLTFTDAKAAEMLEDVFGNMEDGMILADILEDLTLTGDEQITHCATAILIQVQAGKPFSEASRGWFSPTLSATLAAAERSNNFASTGKDVLKTMVGGSQSLLGAALARVGVPALYLVVLFGMAAYMTVEIFPVLETVMPRERWKGTTWLVYNTGGFVARYWPLMIAGVAAFYLGARVALRRWAGPLRRNLDASLPYVKQYREMQGSRVLLSLGVLLAAGEPLRRAVGTVQGFETPHLAWYLRRMTGRIDAGLRVSQAVDVGLFSVQEIVALRRRERQQGFAEAVVQVARRAAESRTARLRALLVLPQVLLYLLDAALLLAIFDGLRVSL